MSGTGRPYKHSQLCGAQEWAGHNETLYATYLEMPAEESLLLITSIDIIYIYTYSRYSFGSPLITETVQKQLILPSFYVKLGGITNVGCTKPRALAVMLNQ